MRQYNLKLVAVLHIAIADALRLQADVRTYLTKLILDSNMIDNRNTKIFG